MMHEPEHRRNAAALSLAMIADALAKSEGAYSRAEALVMSQIDLTVKACEGPLSGSQMAADAGLMLRLSVIGWDQVCREVAKRQREAHAARQ